MTSFETNLPLPHPRPQCSALHHPLPNLAGQIFLLVFSHRDLTVITSLDNSAHKHSLFSQVIEIPSPSAKCHISFPNTALLPPATLHINMAKKRRSLQSIFIPSFFISSSPPRPPTSTPTPTPPSIQRSASSMSSYFSLSHSYPTPTVTQRKAQTISSAVIASGSPPPDYLLDDDPFANLSHASHCAYFSYSSPSLSKFPPPGLSHSHFSRSPLRTSLDGSPVSSPSGSISSIALPNVASESSPSANLTLSSGPAHARPVHQKPAFASHPSLPSLQTLSQMNITIPKKVRKGKVGAGLPFEPWNISKNNGSVTDTTSQLDIIAPAPSNPLHHFPPDFTHDLDLDMDLDSDPEFIARSRPQQFDGYEQHKHGHESSHDETLSHVPLSDAYSPWPPIRSASDSSFHDYPTSPTLQNYSLRTPYGNTKHLRTTSQESDIDPLNLPPEFNDFSYAESYSHFLSRPPSELDSHWEFTHSRTTLSAPVDIPAPHPPLHSSTEFLDEEDMLYEPGSSAATIRSPLHEWANGRNRSKSVSQIWTKGVSEAEAVDGNGWDGAQKQSSNGYTGGWDLGGSGGGIGGGGGRENGGGGSNWPGSGSGQGGDDRDGDRFSNTRSAFSSDSDVSTSDEEEQTSTDDYGQDSPPLAQTRPEPASDHAGSTDDDVPLAQRIPTALQAQRTIRKQVLDEKDQRKKERALRRQQKRDLGPESRHPVPHPTAPTHPADTSGSRKTAVDGFPATRRPRTRTLPGIAMKPFAIEDLTKRLLKVHDTPPLTGHHDETLSSKDASHQLKNSPGVKPKEQPANQQPLQDKRRPLRLTKSFHKGSSRQTDDQRTAPTRSVSNINGRSRDDALTSTPRSLPDHSRKISKSYVSTDDDRKPETTGGHSTPQTSIDLTISPVPRRSLQRQPVSLGEVLANLAQPTAKVQTTQQRVFVGDMQRFNMVEISPSTSAKDVITAVEEQGTLKEWIGSGGWMLWEVAQDFGMERPIRSFELISDVWASWNKDKTVNALILKTTIFEPLLTPSAIPSSSPKHCGYVMWESKRGKWSKRWMELREHSLWLSKRNTGKDETFLCSLSAFDAYFLTRPHKSPKPFVFAVKSLDNMSFFENAADYLHVFSCGRKEGEKWTEMILLARSYILQQERNVLSTKTSNPGVNSSPASSHAISRAGTRRQQPPGQRPAQPLVQVSAPFTVVPTNPVFEPGSLLGQS